MNKRVIGCNIISVEEITSTNDLAKEYAKGGAKEGTTVIASSQTGGKGRLGRQFFSPSGKGIYMSVILRPSCAAEESLLITSFAAVGVARAIKKVCGLQAEIKWINDLYLGGKKVCGILTEALFEDDEIKHIILGIGINVKATDFPDELLEIATSIENETGKSVSREDLSRQILDELNELYENFTDGGFLEESRELSNVIGKEIRVIKGSESYLARAVGIDDKGGLIIETDEKRKILYSGEISIRVTEGK